MKPDHTEFETIFEGIKAGKVAVPNLEEIPAEDLLSHILGWRGGGIPGDARIPGTQYGTATALYFQTCTQGGRFTGAGYVAWSNGWSTERNKYVTKAGKFAICKHTPVEDPGANHSRGWHPAHCSTCGLDMSVDSGD